MKTRLIRIILFLVPVLSFTMRSEAQIVDEIRSYIDTTEILVNNGRKLLIKRIEEKDYMKALEIYQYLTRITMDKNYSAFTYMEDLYINLLIGDWNNASIYMLDYRNKSTKMINPSSYQIYNLLYQKVSESADSLNRQAETVLKDDESEQVYGLLFYILKNKSVDSKYNEMYRKFRKEYRLSKYEDFVTHLLPGKYVKASLSFALGSGTIIPAGGIADHFSSNASFGMSMDVDINRLYTSLYVIGSNFKLKDPFSVIHDSEQMSFEMNEKFHYITGGLKTGYFIVRDKRIHLAPYISVSGSTLESTRFETEKDGKEYRIFNSFTYGTGIDAEIKLFNSTTMSYYGYPSDYYISLKLGGGFDFLVKTKDPYKGHLTYLNAGLCFAIGEF